MHPMRERGAAAGVIMMDSLRAQHVSDLSDVLSSRLPGVVVQRSSGTIGIGSSIHIRGISSLQFSHDPLLVIDGVRVDGTTADVLMSVGGQGSSRLDDLDPEEIERIEVLRGPASAALYGGDASAGVILVTTRRGRAGKTTWRAHTEFGAANETTRFPANFYRPGTSTISGDSVACPLTAQGAGSCIPGALMVWNPIERATPFRTGLQQRDGLSVSGGRGARTYFLSGDFDHEAGVYSNNDRRRINVRANVASRIGDKLDLALSTGYVNGSLTLPTNDLSDVGILFNALEGFAVDDSVRHGYRDAAPTSLLALHASADLERWTAGLTTVWQPAGWMRWTTTIGVDDVHESGREASGDEHTGGLTNTGLHTDAAERSRALTVRTGVTADYPLAASLRAEETVGAEYESDRGVSNWQDVPDLLSSEAPLYPPSFRKTEAASVGGYVRERLAWRDALIATAAVRGDKRTEPDEKFELHPSAELSWIVSNEPFFPGSEWLCRLKLRAAFGSTARFGPSMTTGDAVVGSNQGSILFTTHDDPSPKPERTREIEAGVDATLLGERLELNYTHYSRTTNPLMLLQPIPPTYGSGVTWVDIGSMSNRGDELALHAGILRARPVRWSVAMSGAWNTNKVTTRGGATGVLTGGLSGVNDMQLIRSGYPAGGYWAWPIRSYEDKNGDGIISSADCSVNVGQPADPACEIQFGDLSFFGSAIPTREISLSSDVTLFDRLTVSALLDHQGGFSRFDATRQERCYLYQTCRAAEDPTAPLADQAAAAASLIGSDAGYIEDASFWKLRQLAATITLPASWARRLAVRDVRLTVAGRNLVTWTRYRGLDPEVNALAADPLLSAEWFTQPLARYVTVRIDVMW